MRLRRPGHFSAGKLIIKKRNTDKSNEAFQKAHYSNTCIGFKEDQEKESSMPSSATHN